MAGFAGRRAQALLIAILTYFAVTTAGFGIGAHWRNEDRAPGVMLLGSGSHVSILVVDGDARLLIASGDDASAFGNALAEAMHPTSRRIDVVVIDGDERSGAVAARVRRDIPGATTFVMPGELANRLADFNLQPDDVIAKDTHIALTSELTVTIFPGSDGDNGWHAGIRRRSTRVLAISDGKMAPMGQQVSAIVFTDRYDASALAGSGGRAVIVPSGATSLDKLRADAQGTVSTDFALFVGDGEAIKLKFTDRGIELPSDAI